MSLLLFHNTCENEVRKTTSKEKLERLMPQVVIYIKTIMRNFFFWSGLSFRLKIKC